MVRNAAEVVMSSQAPKCSGMVSLGANSVRETKVGVFKSVILAMQGASKGIERKVNGRLCHGACSTEPKRASGASRRETLTAGVVRPVVAEIIGMLRKVLSARQQHSG